jgi:hypothetical protein
MVALCRFLQRFTLMEHIPGQLFYAHVTIHNGYSQLRTKLCRRFRLAANDETHPGVVQADDPVVYAIRANLL